MQKAQHILIGIFLITFFTACGTLVWLALDQPMPVLQETYNLGPIRKSNSYIAPGMTKPDIHPFIVQGHVNLDTRLATFSWHIEGSTEMNALIDVPVKFTSDGWELFGFSTKKHPVFFQKTKDLLILEWGPYFEARGTFRHRVTWPLHPARTPQAEETVPEETALPLPGFLKTTYSFPADSPEAPE